MNLEKLENFEEDRLQELSILIVGGELVDTHYTTAGGESGGDIYDTSTGNLFKH
jgi:hypothetical protein